MSEGNFDYFLYHGLNDLDDEITFEIRQILQQPKRSLFYSRSRGGAGIDRYENTPVGISLQAVLPYDIVMAIAQRNLYVTSGENNLPDRRVATSQTQVSVETDAVSGEVKVSVLYIPLKDITQTNTVSVRI